MLDHMKTSFLILIALLLVGGGAYAYVQTKQEVRSLPEDSSADTLPIVEMGYYTYDYNDTIGLDGAVKSKQLVFVSPSKTQIVVPTDIAIKISLPIRFQETGQRDGENLNTGILATHPANQNQIILATHAARANSSGTASGVRMLNRIYSYDIRTNKLNLLNTSGEDTSGEVDRELIIIASQSSKVILFSHTLGTGGPCTNVWLNTPDRYTYLDMRNLDVGLQPYVIPTTKIQEETAIQEKCVQNLDAGIGP